MKAMNGVVTIAVPVYKRLQYLPGALQSVAGQDYPHIELIVSDNGNNGDAVEQIVRTHYDKPYRLRRTNGGIPITAHYNELVEAATGEYFVLLADDDELSPNYCTALVAALERNTQAGFALARLEVMDETGRIVPRNLRGLTLPSLMRGEDFVRAWCRDGYPFVCFTTTLARTAEMRAVGKYPEFPLGSGVDNALVLKLSLGGSVAFADNARFRYRVYENSHGLGLPIESLAADLRHFLRFLDQDPVMQDYAKNNSHEWPEIRGLLVRMTWRTYCSRWKRMYRSRMRTAAWVRSAFNMPFIGAYYRAVARVLVRSAIGSVRRRVLGGILPAEATPR
jgi:glycosyltransferase involved in cell wall biosynthesis